MLDTGFSMVVMVHWLMVISSWFIVHGSLTELFGVYLLIRKRAVLRYIWRLLAVYVSLLANICVLYQILSLISSRFEKNVRDTALYSGRSLVRSELK